MWFLFVYIKNVNFVLEVFIIVLMGLFVVEIIRVKFCFLFFVLKVSCFGFIVMVMLLGEIIEVEYVELVNLIFVIVFVKLVVRVGVDEECLRIVENEG